MGYKEYQGDCRKDPILGELTTQAATTLMQNTASIVAEKVQSIKARRNDKEAVADLTEIINDLVEKNAQLQSLAQAYKQELVAQQITEEGIDYIAETLMPLVEKMLAASEKPALIAKLSAGMPALSLAIKVKNRQT